MDKAYDTEVENVYNNAKSEPAFEHLRQTVFLDEAQNYEY
jgi:hypothetical protein